MVPYCPSEGKGWILAFALTATDLGGSTMADMTPTTPAGANEALQDAAHFTHTPISTLFSRLLGAMAHHIECERDIEHVDVFDPAFNGWLKDAEEAATVVTTLISKIRQCRIQRRADVPLMRLKFIADTMLGANAPDVFLEAHGLLSHPHLFALRENGAVAYRVTAMIKTAKTCLNLLAELETDEPVGDVDALSDDLSLGLDLAA